MLPCFHQDLYCTLCPRRAFFLFPFFLFFSSFDFVSSYLKKISFPLNSLNDRISSAPFYDLHYTTQSCILLASSSQLSFSCSDRLSHITTDGHSFSPQESSFFAMKLLRTYLGSCASIVQAVVAARPTGVSTKPVA